MTVDTSDLSYALAGYGKRRNPYEDRRKYGYDLMKQGVDTSPIQSGWQGAARLAQALAGGLDVGMADYQEKAADKKRSDALAQAMAEPDPQKRMGLLAAYDPDRGAAAAGQWAVEQAKQQEAQKLIRGADLGAGYGQPQGLPGPLPQGGVPGGTLANNSGNIRASAAPWQDKGAPQNGFETFPTPQAGANAHVANYQAYAKANPGITVAQAIAQWSPSNENNTQAIIKQLAESTGINPGMPLAQVLQDPATMAILLDAQTRLEKGGLPQGFNADTFTTAANGQRPPPSVASGPPVQLAGAPSQIPQQGDAPGNGMPPPPNPAGVSGPAVIAPPSVPDMPRPQPTPDMIAKHNKLLQSGEYGTGQDAISKARAALEADLDRQWNVNRERSKMQFEQQQGDYRANRDQTIKQPQENVQNESKMREQFDNLQTVKDYRKSQAVFQSAVKAANTNSAAADLNLVYAFATMMDPGSVVREGEMGMVKATQNASDQVKAMVAAVSGGQRISPEARQALVDQMHVRYESLKAQHDELGNAFGNIADRSGMKRDNVVVPIPTVPWTRSKGNQRGAPGDTVYGLDGKPVP